MTRQAGNAPFERRRAGILAVDIVAKHKRVCGFDAGACAGAGPDSRVIVILANPSRQCSKHGMCRRRDSIATEVICTAYRNSGVVVFATAPAAAATTVASVNPTVMLAATRLGQTGAIMISSSFPTITSSFFSL